METKTIKDFDAVQYAREQKDKLSELMSKMTKEEIIAYFKKIRLESQVKPNLTAIQLKNKLIGKAGL